MYVIYKVLGFVVIDEVEEFEVYDDNGSVRACYSDCFISDSMSEAEAEYDIMMEKQRRWLLIKNVTDGTLRVDEYVDGPAEFYVADEEQVLGQYICEELAESALCEYKKKLSYYVIVGNRYTGELRSFLYTGGLMSNYLYEDEELVRMSNVAVINPYEKCRGWTNKWKDFYNSCLS